MVLSAHRYPLTKYLFIAALSVITLTSYATGEPILDYSAASHPVVGREGMVVSRDIIASRVGADILARGGNAIDAAVATGFALAVSFPQAGNIGGGGFMMVYVADEDKTIAVDYREMAPALATRDLFIGSDGKVDQSIARYSHKSAGVPGTVSGFAHVLEKYGTMTLQQVLEPAIKLAREGFMISDTLASSLASRSERLTQNTASAGYFFKSDGSNYRYDDILKQPDLAETLTHIANKGADGFYKGPVADKIVAEMKRTGGLITHQDLINYKTIEREPVFGDYRGYQIASMPPPSSGGIHLIQMLNMLEGWNLKELGHNSAAYLHRLTEVMRRAYADRSEYLGDPDFHNVPIQKLINKDYAAERRVSIDLNKASLSSDIKPGLKLTEESPQTTHYSVWDKYGNVVSNTYTLNFSYGSGISVAGAGFLLNNEMDDFSAKLGVPNAYGLVGGEANAIQGGKRPLSSMTPTIVFKEGKPWLATGSPGGSTIITVVLQTILNTIDFNMNVAEASNADRIHHQWLPDVITLEKDINVDTRRLLKQSGHTLSGRNRSLGRTSSIMFDGEFYYGFCDERYPSGGVAY